MSSWGRVGLSVGLALGLGCEANHSNRVALEEQSGGVEPDEELELKIDGRYWTVSSFVDEPSGMWCYTARYQFSDDFRSGIACLPLTSLPRAPATGQLTYEVVDDVGRMMRFRDEKLGIVCLSMQGDLDCHRAGTQAKEGASPVTPDG